MRRQSTLLLSWWCLPTFGFDVFTFFRVRTWRGSRRGSPCTCCWGAPSKRARQGVVLSWRTRTCRLKQAQKGHATCLRVGRPRAAVTLLVEDPKKAARVINNQRAQISRLGVKMADMNRRLACAEAPRLTEAVPTVEEHRAGQRDAADLGDRNKRRD